MDADRDLKLERQFFDHFVILATASVCSRTSSRVVRLPVRLKKKQSASRCNFSEKRQFNNIQELSAIIDPTRPFVNELPLSVNQN